MEKATLNFLLNHGYSIIRISRASTFYTFINEAYKKFQSGKSTEADTLATIAEYMSIKTA